MSHSPLAPSWTPSAHRLQSLPLILAGPILRRTEPRSVTVWVALREARRVTLRVYRWDPASGGLTGRLHGSHWTVRLGEYLHVVAVTARAPDETSALEPGEIYCYDLFFESEEDEENEEDEEHEKSEQAYPDAPSLRSTGVLVGDPDTASPMKLLTYPELPLPSFVLPATALENVRIFHGSCRNPHGVGRDALATLDQVLSRSARDPITRPQQLYLTGDQIYADDVAEQLLWVLAQTAEVLVGHEDLPDVPTDAFRSEPGQRTKVVRDVARFTTTTPENQLLTRGEYLAMYLFAWSDVLWPTGQPSPEEVWQVHPLTQPSKRRERQQAMARWQRDERELTEFREMLPQVRRALANIPTYMICDDHDVTDDWYLDGAWCANVLGSALGRRIIRNALVAYAFCQAWGNDPDQFEEPNGQAFLELADRWREDEAGKDGGADELELAEYLGLPEGFSGQGELTRSERALHWHFTVETPAYRMLVLDARTRRIYDHPHAAPGLLSEEAMAEQIAAPGAGDERLMMLVAPTPVLGVDIVEKIQLLSLDHYAFDRESWMLNRRVCQRLLRRLSEFERVVILSGDVHYGFGSTMECWQKAEGGSAQGKAIIVNFTSSAFKNVASGVQKALLTVAYPHLFHLLSRGRMPPIDLFAWDEGTPENADALAAATHAVQHGVLAVWWSVPRVATLLRSPSALMLPAHGWPAHTFDQSPPARRLRLRYLCDALSPVEPERHLAAPGAALAELTATHHQQISETVAALTSDAHVGVEKALEATRVLQSSEYPYHVRLGVAQRLLELAQTVFRGDHTLQDLVNAGIGHLLHAALQHPGLWTSMWSDGGLHFVGDANIGEVSFEQDRESATAGLVAVQRLWWRPATAPDGLPLPATEYRVSLQAPAPGDVPTLP
jgi:hypothetical protein